jgi:hypothetical protein
LQSSDLPLVPTAIFPIPAQREGTLTIDYPMNGFISLMKIAVA